MEKLSKRYAQSHNLIAEHEPYPIRVLQFGEGNFLRAFIDWFIDLLNEKTAFKGSVLLVQPTPKGTIARQAEQDFLWTLFLRGVQNGAIHNEKRVISCVAGGVDPYSNWEGYLETAHASDIRFIFSNTTEAGIVYTKTKPADEAVPTSFPAKLAAWLYERYRFFKGDKSKGCLIIPCELIEANAANLKNILLKHAQDWNYETGFFDWLTAACAFVNTLVDRVVSGFPKEEAAGIWQQLGYEDTLLDVGEYFHLFVLEAPKKYEKELPFKDAGINAIWTDDVRPYRERKVKILNGAHTSVSLAAYLTGKETVREYAEDPLLASFLTSCVYDELAPTVPFPPAECKAFADAVIERFKNPFVDHLCLSIALNSVSKYKVRVLPSLIEQTKRNGAPPRGLCFALAALIVFYHIKSNKNGKRYGVTEDGREYPIVDDEAVLINFETYWNRRGSLGCEKELSRIVLGDVSFWGINLNDVSGLTDAVAVHLSAIAKSGIVSALSQIL